jgi:hypothetical protein
VTANQEVGHGQWNELGVFTFNVGAGHHVELTDATADGDLVVADAVRFEYVGDAGVPSNDPPQIGALTATPTAILDTETSQLQVTASDPDGGASPLNYQWIVPAGHSVDDQSNASPVFYPGDVASQQVVTLQVRVSDGAATVTASVDVSIADSSSPPPADIIIDNAHANTAATGVWGQSEMSGGYGGQSLFSNGAGIETFRFLPTFDVCMVDLARESLAGCALNDSPRWRQHLGRGQSGARARSVERAGCVHV